MQLVTLIFIDTVTLVNRWLFRIAGLFILLIVVVMLYAIVSRYGFNHPSEWGLELATLLFGPYFLLGGPYLLHTGGHVNLDLLRRASSPRANRIFDLVNYPVIAVFALILLYYSWPFAVQSFWLSETSYTSWNPVIWPVKFVIPLAFVLLFLQALAEWVRLFIGDKAKPQSCDDAGEIL